MNFNDHDRLWRGVVGGEDLDPLRRASLEVGLAALRSRRRRRQGWMIAGTAAPLALILVFVWPAHFVPLL